MFLKIVLVLGKAFLPETFYFILTTKMGINSFIYVSEKLLSSYCELNICIFNIYILYDIFFLVNKD